VKKNVRRQTAARRVRRRPADKFEERRAEHAAAALQTLAELGYARTSLREIAQNTEFTHGVLHYYFADKFELIMFCVRQYKVECVQRYDEAVASATSAAQLVEKFSAAMVATLRADTVLHRLWYDLRTQSLFEPSFQADVADIDRSLERMIWRVVTEYARLSGAPLAVDAPLAYALFDGMFEQALRKQIHGDRRAGRALTRQIAQVLPTLITANRRR
jgi:AcrR family transcriptional regulator